MMHKLLLLAAVMLACIVAPAFAQTTHVVGEVVTARNFTGPNDTVGVVRFEDPRIPGAFCYFPSANKGGFSANFGLQEDRSEYVLDCFATGTLNVPADLPDNEIISERSRSMLMNTPHPNRADCGRGWWGCVHKVVCPKRARPLSGKLKL